MSVYVLDTDVGYDPDDLMAIWMFATRFSNGHIITSAEVRVGAKSNARARVVCRLLREFPDVTIYAGSPGTAGLNTVLSSRRTADPSRFTGWAKTQFQCAHKKEYEQIVATCLLDETDEYDARIKHFDEFKDSIVRSYSDGSDGIVWIGIGAMTNLAMLLSSPEFDERTMKINVVQMGVCSKNVKKYAPTNIFLDPAAAVYANMFFKGEDIHGDSSLIYVGSDFTSKVPWLHGGQLHAAGYGGWIQGGKMAKMVGERASVSKTPHAAFKEVYGIMSERVPGRPGRLGDGRRVEGKNIVFNGCREIWEDEPVLKECIIANVVSDESLGGEYFGNRTYKTGTKLYFDTVNGVKIPKCGKCWPWDSNFHDILTVYIATQIYEHGVSPEELGCQQTVIDLRERDGALEHWSLPDEQIFDSNLIPKVYVDVVHVDQTHLAGARGAAHRRRTKIPPLMKNKYGTKYKMSASGDQIEVIKAHILGLLGAERDENADDLIAEMEANVVVDENWAGWFRDFGSKHAPWKDEFKTQLYVDPEQCSRSKTYITTKHWKMDGPDIAECMRWVYCVARARGHTSMTSVTEAMDVARARGHTSMTSVAEARNYLSSLILRL